MNQEGRSLQAAKSSRPTGHKDTGFGVGGRQLDRLVVVPSCPCDQIHLLLLGVVPPPPLRVIKFSSTV